MAPETLLTTGTVWLKKYYYDTYGIVSGNANFAYTAKSGYGTRHEYRVEGTDISTRNMLCAEEEKVLGLDTEKVLTTVWYYDDKGRVVQEIRTNIMGGYDKTYTAYTFTGLPSETLQEHTVPGKDSVTERYRFVYDNAERIKQKYYRLNSDAEILLQECTYNDFGQLQQESVNGGYVKHAYTYNVRGWLSGQTSGYGGSTDNAFDLMLYTSNPKSGGSVSYNGNISAIEWTSKLDNVTRGYSFSYDGLGRMTSGVYGEGASLGTNTDRYNETLTYDRNGNIKTLLRSGRLDNGSFGPIDNLSMTLSGNRILSVAEGCANQSSNDLMEYKNTGSGGSRAYDANGRLTSDGNRGITGIEYNVLNLPTKITFTNGSAIRYGYSYSGEKLWTKYSFSSEPLFEPLSSPATGLSSTGNESERYYSGNKIYNDGTLEMILIDGGYIRKENTGYAYHHYIKDHLGSNRMVVKVNSGVQQVQHYYPFGLSFAEATNRSYQPYKYNGKELVSDEGLNWYDYLARVYDPALLIFTTMDPMAEKYYSISPYAYCGNNPVNAYDLNGDSITTIVTSMVNGKAINTTYYYGQDAQGNYGFLDSNGQMYTGEDQFVASLTTALGNIRSGAKGQTLVNDLMNSTNTVKIAQARKDKGNSAASDGTYIVWSPNSAQGGPDQTGSSIRPTYIGLGHEMGHIKHNDMIVTAIVSLVPMICYYIALSFMFSRNNENNAGIIIGILGYVFYLIGQLLVLFISRTREYYADEASVEYGNRPADLVSALYKLSYGAARCDDETIKDVNTVRAFFVNDVDNATRDLNDFRQIDFDGDGSISEEELRELSQRNVDVSTSNKIMELFSTHPDSLKRVKRLSELEN